MNLYKPHGTKRPEVPRSLYWVMGLNTRGLLLPAQKANHEAARHSIIAEDTDSIEHVKGT